MKLIYQLQFFLSASVATLVSCVRIIILSKISTRAKNIKQHDSCVILANGPSLTQSIAQHTDFLHTADLWVVNMFANTEYFVQFKPRFYIILAPELWQDSVPDAMKQAQQTLFTNLAQTNWEMYLYVPHLAKKYNVWRTYFQNHAHIRTQWFNPTPIDGFKNFSYKCFSWQLGMPRPHNILTPALIMSINQAYSTIYLLGVDHSWMPELWVSDANEVYLTQKHFYDEASAQAAFMNNAQFKPRKLHEILHKFMCAFASYFTIRSYAEKKSVNILNATPRSYIDAFERIRL